MESPEPSACICALAFWLRWRQMRCVEPDPDEMPKQLVDPGVVGGGQRRLEQRIDIGLEMHPVAGAEQHDIDPRFVPNISIAGVDDTARAAVMNEKAERVAI